MRVKVGVLSSPPSSEAAAAGETTGELKIRTKMNVRRRRMRRRKRVTGS